MFSEQPIAKRVSKWLRKIAKEVATTGFYVEPGVRIPHTERPRAESGQFEVPAMRIPPPPQFMVDLFAQAKPLHELQAELQAKADAGLLDEDDVLSH